jgi:hypothetical protein
MSDDLWYGAWDCDQDWYGLVYRWRDQWGWKDVLHKLGPFATAVDALNAIMAFMIENDIASSFDFGKTPNQERITQ